MTPREKVFWARQKLRQEQIVLVQGLCELIGGTFCPELKAITFEQLLQDEGCLAGMQMASECTLKSIAQIESYIVPLLPRSARPYIK